MVSDEYGPEPSPPGMLAGSWAAALLLGALTLILGVVLALWKNASQYPEKSMLPEPLNSQATCTSPFSQWTTCQTHLIWSRHRG